MSAGLATPPDGGANSASNQPLGQHLGEFERIEKLLRPLATDPASLNLQDDTAILSLPPGKRLVATMDTLVADVHFLASDPPDSIGAKLLRVNYSDLAAMGAEPYGFLLALSLPKELGTDWLASFVQGLQEDQLAFGGVLLGGDSTSTPGPISLSMTALGTVPIDRALLRSSARAGDIICVSGTIGDGTFGLDAVRREVSILSALSESQLSYLSARYRKPSPRLSLGQALLRHSACAIDISDGLVADCGHIAATSGVSMTLHANEVPLSDAVAALVADNPELLVRAITGGDDYELAFALSPPSLPVVLDECAQIGVPITPIGRVDALIGDAPPAVRVLDNDGVPIEIDGQGWRHF